MGEPVSTSVSDPIPPKRVPAPASTVSTSTSRICRTPLVPALPNGDAWAGGLVRWWSSSPETTSSTRPGRSGGRLGAAPASKPPGTSGGVGWTTGARRSSSAEAEAEPAVSSSSKPAYWAVVHAARSTNACVRGSARPYASFASSIRRNAAVTGSSPASTASFSDFKASTSAASRIVPAASPSTSARGHGAVDPRPSTPSPRSAAIAAARSSSMPLRVAKSSRRVPAWTWFISSVYWSMAARRIAASSAKPISRYTHSLVWRTDSTTSSFNVRSASGSKPAFKSSTAARSLSAALSSDRARCWSASVPF